MRVALVTLESPTLEILPIIFNGKKGGEQKIVCCRWMVAREILAFSYLIAKSLQYQKTPPLKQKFIFFFSHPESMYPTKPLRLRAAQQLIDGLGT